MIKLIIFHFIDLLFIIKKNGIVYTLDINKKFFFTYTHFILFVKKFYKKCWKKK